MSKENGARYIVLPDGKLHPVLNVASARLLSDGTSQSPVSVSQQILNKKEKGLPVGIPNAPDTLPDPKQLANTDWTACTYQNNSGDEDEEDRSGDNTPPTTETLLVGVSADNGKLGEDEAAVVKSLDTGEVWVLANGYRFKIEQLHLLRALNYLANTAQLVDSSWLATIPEGLELKVQVPLVDVGKPAPRYGAPAAFQRVGQVGRVRDTDKYFVVTDQGIQYIKAVTANLLLADKHIQDQAYQGKSAQPILVSQADLQGVAEQTGFVVQDPHWPDTMPKWVNKGGVAVGDRYVLCSTFKGWDRAKNPLVQLAATNRVPTPEGTQPQAVSSGMDSRVADQIVMYQGRGALVRATEGKGTQNGSVFVVTEPGIKYQVSTYQEAVTTVGQGGQDQQQVLLDSVQRLGYQADQISPIPEAWVNLLATGPNLDARAARTMWTPSGQGMPIPQDNGKQQGSQG